MIHLLFLLMRLRVFVKNTCFYLKLRVKYLKWSYKQKKELKLMSKKSSNEKDQIETELEMVEEIPEVNGNVKTELSPALAKNVADANAPAKDKAYSVVFDSQLNKWVAVEVLFNYAAGTLGGMRVCEQNVNRNIIVERFHVLCGQNLL
jgi:hypothetical protein